MATETDAKRLLRLKERSIIKRDGYVNQIRSVYALAQRSLEDAEASHQLLVAVETLDELWSSFSIEDDSVLDHLLALGLSSEYSNYLGTEIREQITFCKATANRYRNNTPEPINTSGEAHNMRDSGSKSNIGMNLNAGLPSIPLPSFSGDIYEWSSFRDRFLSLVDQRPHLSVIDKYYYLIGCLKGTASDVISGIPISEGTYRLAWTTLESRFDKPRLVACSLIEKLLQAPESSSETLLDLNKFVSIFDESISILESLRIPDLGDFILFSLASRCLPMSCRKLFESQTNVEYPTVRELLTFVKSRISILECVHDFKPLKLTHSSRHLKPSSPTSYVKGNRKPLKSSTTSFLTAQPSSSKSICKCCRGSHSVVTCPKFKSWSLEVRSKWAREQRLCFRCLGEGHWAPRCSSSIVCAQCSRNHHTLVHKDLIVTSANKEDTPLADQQNSNILSSCMGQLGSRSVLLGTALVHIRDGTGTLQTARALVDSASQISAITSECSSRLGLRTSQWTASVSGLAGASVRTVQGIVDCYIQPRFAVEPVLPFKAWVFPSITTDMPHSQLSRTLSEKFAHLALADPLFSSPAEIDLLLGADIFAQILNGKRVSVGNSYPVAFGSIFGFIIMGSLPQAETQPPHACPISLISSVESLMKRFWHLEEPESAPENFTDDGLCEAIFREGYVRSDTGRFIVPLPFSKPVSDDSFRGSREVALKRFEQLEKRFATDHRLHELYCQFMSEYISLRHMSLASSPGTYFIPHHAVYRPSDINPKLRVVFDASAMTSSGVSLNSCLLRGPKLQRDVTDVLLLFRLHRHAFTTDICKMYRQILVSPEYRRYQHIFWRSSPYEQLQEYELNTVTYGVNCAPFLAIRVIHSIADLECGAFPSVRQTLLFHTYVDDICVGADTEDEVNKLQRDLITVLHRAGLELKKWSSNTPSVLDKISVEDRACGSLSFDDGEIAGIKVLGLQWNPVDDVFYFTFNSIDCVTTKRGMLSWIARIFDPLGFLSPTVFLAKHLMQRVWKTGLTWDEQLPPDIMDPWQKFVCGLPDVQHLSIPRFINTRHRIQGVLCGFCDASERGYAAVVYLRTITPSGYPSISLIGTKTKLAPTGSTTIPRLELCAALLLSRWMSRIKNTLSLEVDITDVFAWTDSTIVLNWLTVRHVTFKVFVSNRINQIQSLLPECHWNYVTSTTNPADCASRGILPYELITHELYWKGPALLKLPMQEWYIEKPSMSPDQLPEIKPANPVALALQPDPQWISRFSSYVHMIRVIARVRRFISRCRRQQWPELYLTRSELDQAALVVAYSSQQHFFENLHHALSHSLPVSEKSIARLRPFIDKRGLIVVGGRLSNSELPVDRKHPILLAKSSHLSLLLVRHFHDVTGHGGPRIVTSLIGRQYWILSVRSLIRTVISHCTICVRLSAANPQPMMADLPRSRVSEVRPFSQVGIDYAGPFLLKEHRLRKARQYKIYISIFVCFAVKAVHLEIVTDLSTDAFIAALQRFAARRGLPNDIYTDCGTNFVGAARQIRSLINDPINRDKLVASLHCNWHFNPPGAPHFGGLWEAAVRSAKSLMVRIMGEHIFTFEEFGTILCRIESILNSRPLTQASTDPTEVECLTPGHFLIGQPLLAVPETDLNAYQRPLIQRWKLLNQCVQSFWRRWRDEYLQTLQIRSKWIKNVPNIAVNDMVIMKDPQTPPLQWRIARVVETFPGSDGIVRVVRLRLPNGFLIRPVVKLVKLPT